MGMIKDLFEIKAEILKCTTLPTIQMEDGEVKVDEETGEIIDEAAIIALDMDFKEKLDSLLSWQKQEEAFAEAIKKEAKAIEERAKRHSNKSDQLTNLIKTLLEGKTFENERHQVTYRMTPGSVVIKDESLIPFEYMKPAKPTPDKTAIGKLLKAGTEVPGCELNKENKMYIK